MDAAHIKKHASFMFASHPTIYHLLRDAVDHRAARNHLQAYLIELQRMMNRYSQRIQPLEWIVQEQSLHSFQRLISVRSERISKFRLVKMLWLMAHGKTSRMPENLNAGFFEEMIRLFRGLRGESGIYDRTPYPEFMKYHGREASLMRSDQLDTVAEKVMRMVRRYPTGLDPAVRRLRQKNASRILLKLGGGGEDWQDYRWHLGHLIRTSKDLERLIRLSREEKEGIDDARKAGLPFGITPYYVSLMDSLSGRRNDHAVRAQVIPPTGYVETMIRNRGKDMVSSDFMMERDTSPVDLVTRRYPTIVILKPYNTCSQICVYCQRNWEIDGPLSPSAMAAPARIQKAIDWIEDHRGVREVLVTGGDPLVMHDGAFLSVLGRVAGIRHVERIRIGSRTPVVLPMRITDHLADEIARFHEPGQREICLVTHFEHVYEVTPEAMEAVQKFRRRGMAVYNQAVFTAENSRRFEMTALRRILRLIGVDPYYTFNTKGKEETKDYRVPIARLLQEIKEEARLLPGLVRADEPVYNVPKLGKNYIRAQQHHSLLTILPNGNRVYEFHPWEKNLSMAETYVDEDVSIYDYLCELKRRGEDPEDYRTIWYYY
ncbi:KamA family radical SAM protein [bacterium]|nr:KamA family radical SAM protein [bacterium]